MGVEPKIGVYINPPKMDGENNGNPYVQMDDLGGVFPLFLETSIYVHIISLFTYFWGGSATSTGSGWSAFRRGVSSAGPKAECSNSVAAVGELGG